MSGNLNNLSFVARRKVGGGFNHWSGVEAGADYSADCETGERLADEFVNEICTSTTVGNARLLAPIVQDMHENGATKGHKVGFFGRVSEHLQMCATIAREGIELSSSLSPKLIRAVDKIDETRSMIHLVACALESMSSAGDRDIDAIQRGLEGISAGANAAREAVENARSTLSTRPAHHATEIEDLELLIENHKTSLAHSIAVSDGSQAENERAHEKEMKAFDAVLQMQCQEKTSRIRKVGYVLQHLARNPDDIELEHYQLKDLLNSLAA